VGASMVAATITPAMRGRASNDASRRRQHRGGSSTSRSVVTRKGGMPRYGASRLRSTTGLPGPWLPSLWGPTVAAATFCAIARDGGQYDLWVGSARQVYEPQHSLPQRAPRSWRVIPATAVASNDS
jgi:hypothetical protein